MRCRETPDLENKKVAHLIKHGVAWTWKVKLGVFGDR